MTPNGLWSFILPRVLAVSIRVKIMGIALGLVLLLGVSVTLLVRRNFRETLQDQLVERGTEIASNVAARSTGPILAKDIYALHDFIAEVVTSNDDVRYVFVQGRGRNVIAHTFEGAFPMDLLAASAAGGADLATRVETLDTEEGTVFDIACPVPAGQAGGPIGSPTAFVHVGMWERQLSRIVAAITRHLLIVTGIASLLGVIAAYVLTAVLTRPILELVDVVQAVGGGDFQRRARLWADDEIGRLSTAFNAMTESLSRSREKLREEERMRSQLLEKVITAQEEERKRIARELHDQTSQSLTSLMVGLKTVEMAPTFDEAMDRVARLRALTADTLSEVHALALGLRPSVLDDLGLIAALERYAQDFSRQFGIRVDYHATHFGDGRRLPSHLETSLYRIVQEAMTNAAKHARSENISILIERKAEAVLVIVEDDGKGFDVALAMGSQMETKLGLFGMQERASLLGGRLTIESNPGVGTTIFVEVPVDGERRVDARDQGPARG